MTGGDDAMKNVYGSTNVQLQLKDEMLSKKYKTQDDIIKRMEELYKPRAYDDIPELFKNKNGN